MECTFTQPYAHDEHPVLHPRRNRRKLALPLWPDPCLWAQLKSESVELARLGQDYGRRAYMGNLKAEWKRRNLCASHVEAAAHPQQDASAALAGANARLDDLAARLAGAQARVAILEAALATEQARAASMAMLVLRLLVPCRAITATMTRRPWEESEDARLPGTVLAAGVRIPD